MPINFFSQKDYLSNPVEENCIAERIKTKFTGLIHHTKSIRNNNWARNRQVVTSAVERSTINLGMAD